MPVLTRKSLPKFPITDETVEAWLTTEFEGSPLEPTLAMAKECALAILNEQREENELEPLVRCPKEAAETALSYIQDIAKEWNAELADDEVSAADQEDEADDEESDEDEGKSLIKRKYKERYKPFKMTNGDDIAQLLTAHVKTLEGDDGKLHVDLDKLERFAKLNGCWNEAYRNLNPGQARMNVGNRLRAKVRKDASYEIRWN